MSAVWEIPPRNESVEDFRARIEAKREEQHRIWALEKAALDAKYRKPKPTPQAPGSGVCEHCGDEFEVPPNVPRKRFCSKRCRNSAGHLRSGRRAPVRPCIDCGALTRPQNATATAYPGTILRFQQDRCHSCWRTHNKKDRTCRLCGKRLPATANINKVYCSERCRKRSRKVLGTNIKPCEGCGRPTRPHGTSADDYPGTLLRYRRGKCKTCVVPKPERLPRHCRDCDKRLPDDAYIKREFCDAKCRRRYGKRKARQTEREGQAA